MAITPAATPRQVIPFGDRPIIDSRGHPTFDFYQWMQRVGAGVTTSITNIDTTVTEVNTVTINLAGVENEISEIQTEIAAIDTSIGQLFGWVQIFLNNAPPPPPPPTPPPPAASVHGVAPFPPSPPKWPGAGNFIALESGGVPEAVSAMPAASLPLAGTELVPVVQGGANVSATPDAVLVRSGDVTLSAGGRIVLDAPQIGTVDVTTGTSEVVYLQSGGGSVTGNTGDIGLQSGDLTGTGASGQAFLGTGGTDSGNAGRVSIYTGSTSGAGNSGAVDVTTGNSTGGDSGEISLTTGTAGGTRGRIVLDAALISFPTAGDVSLLGVDVGAGVTSAELDFITGNATGAAGVSGPMFLGTGNSAAAESGQFSAGSGTAGTTSGFADIFSGDAVTLTGDAILETGNASGGDSGNAQVKTGTASGTRGNVILDGRLVVLVGLPTVAPATSGAVWRDAGAGNVLKAVP